MSHKRIKQHKAAETQKLYLIAIYHKIVILKIKGNQLGFCIPAIVAITGI